MSSISSVGSGMTINVNQLYNAGNNEDNSDNSSNGVKSGIINANNLNLAQDTVDDKRKKAMEKALDVIGKTFNSDVDKDKEMSDRQDRIDELKLLIRDAHNSAAKSDEELASLKEEYHIDDNSKEQKDLELLEKRIDSQRENSHIKLTDDEKAQLAKIDEEGLTEYQERALQAYEPKSVNESAIKEYEKELDYSIKSLQAAKLDRLKSNPMVDSQKEADKILQASSKDIVSDLIDEVKENIDEKTEEQKDKAEKQEEKQEELDDIINKDKDNKEDDITDEIPLDDYNKAVNVRHELDTIIKDSGLSQEDLLGLSVNQQA